MAENGGACVAVAAGADRVWVSHKALRQPVAENGGACVAVAAGADRVWVSHKALRQPVAENGGACVAVAAGADRGGPPLWQVVGPQQGRVSHRTLEAARG
ncbi:cytochrome c2 [Saccharomonospora amisosensis]|uniref:Cytochrome c2 n=1 Tax=Saccharomonospora amisosensis TaxID=1128677 RepID=A0A7X5UNC6_9PSEU|nr:cytochrome c2 [Saccharomonospora amisosensis]